MVAGGAALARDEAGRVIFVEGALPGEIVTAQLTEARADFGRARALEIILPSPDRVFPPCPALAAGCGGCTWQHITPEAQVRFKAGIVLDALRRIGRLRAPPDPVVVAMDGPALRTTARLAVSPGGRAGYRRRRGPDAAVETDSCLAAHPLVEELITAGRYPGAAEVLLRAGVASGERLVKTTPSGGEVQVPAGVTVVGDDGAPAWVHETVAGRRFRVGADSFFQPGPVAAAALVSAVVSAVGEEAARHVVDAYCGVGLFASVLGARLGVTVTAVESDRSAIADARVNLADIDARIVASDVGRWRLRRRDAAVDVVIADPPRPGLGRIGVDAVVATRAPRVVLVSCDPASLGRDAALLRPAGYHLESVALVDAFPHTFHVETVSRFQRTGQTR
jgi:tRNA/tmRNA/rRNA uracil-C5-methylase (TrmA/RlmC/RlmD family)